MPALGDVNLLLALITNKHPHHPVAAAWFESLEAEGMVICRVAQLGMMRLLNNPAVMKEEVFDGSACWKKWHALCRDERVVFEPQEPPGLGEAFEGYTKGCAFSPNLWTDAYLAAYARAANLELTTFDKGFKSFAGLKCNILSPAG